jgi:glycosyltransferase involved in cell wall biosynthesis
MKETKSEGGIPCVVCFSSSDWWSSHPYAVVHTMREFSRRIPVLFVNTVSPGIPKITSASFFRKLFRKLPSLLRVFRRAEPNLYVLTPLSLPYGKSRLLERLNRAALLFQVKTVLLLLGFRKPLLWMANLYAVNLARRLKYGKLVFVCTDKWDKSEYAKDKERLRQDDAELTRKADMIVCVSRNLERHYRERAGDKVHYLSHAVDFDHFSHHGERTAEIPGELRNLPKPVVGYYGSLTEINDIDLLEYCARRKEEWSFVLIGRASGDYGSLRRLPNVHFLGYRDYMVIPEYARHFDVCIQFWRQVPWIQYCSPLKTKEYLAAGKPVVSTAIPHIEEEFGEVVSCARTREQFLELLETAVREDTPEKALERQERVKNDSWEAYVDKVLSIIQGNGPAR